MRIAATSSSARQAPSALEKGHRPRDRYPLDAGERELLFNEFGEVFVFDPRRARNVRTAISVSLDTRMAQQTGASGMGTVMILSDV
jgi:hypothetical protein